MDFIVNNWVWFLIGGIVILMTIIGYIADKTDFGRKSFSETEKKKEKPQKIEEKPTEPDVQIALATDAISNEEPIKDVLEFEMPTFEPEATTEISYQPEEDLTVPFGNDSEIKLEEPSIEFDHSSIFDVEPKEVKNLDYFDINQTLENEVEDVVEEEPVYVEETQDITNTEIELPDLESLLNNSNIKNTTEEDDVWKF